jgi:hypothetical protein
LLEGARLDLRKGLWQHDQRTRKDQSLPYFKDGYGRTRSAATVNRYTQWLHQVFAHAGNAKYLPGGKNPVDVIARYPEYEPPVIEATPEQREILLTTLERHTPHIREWLELAEHSGLRQTNCSRSLSAKLCSAPRSGGTSRSHAANTKRERSMCR